MTGVDGRRRQFLAAAGGSAVTLLSGCGSLFGGTPGADGSDAATPCRLNLDRERERGTAGWPTRRGDTRNTGAVPSAALPEPPLTVDWIHTLGGFVGTPPPVATNGTAYASNYDTVATAFDPDGTTQWSLTRDVSSGVSVVDGRLLLANTEGIIAVETTRGDHAWTAPLPEQVNAESPLNGTGTQGVVCFGTSLGIVALDTASGERRWRYRTGLATRGTPAVINETVYAGNNDTYVYALDAVDGTLEWRVKTGDRVQCGPAVVDKTVYVGSDDGHVYALNAADGSVEWGHKTPGAVQTVSVTGGHVFAVSDPSRGESAVLHALRQDTGEACWRRNVHTSWQSLVVGLDYLYTPLQRGDDLAGATIGALDTATGDVVWRLRNGDRESEQRRRRFYSGPAVTDGALYVSGLCKQGICLARLVNESASP